MAKQQNYWTAADIFQKTEWNQLCRLHQKNYHKWQGFALDNSLTPVYSELHPEANPWCFPAYVKDQKEAIKWFDWGWDNDKLVFSWPSLPEEVLGKKSESLIRRKRLICFGIA